MKIFTIILFAFLLTTFSGYCQTKVKIDSLADKYSLNIDTTKRHVWGKDKVQKELFEALGRYNGNFAPDLPLIDNAKTAVEVVESILFNIYGKDDIIKQQPYEVYFLNDYWVVCGTHPKEIKGVGFLIIINSKTACVVELIN